MFDPEMTVEPLLDEVGETIQKMRKVKQIDDKVKHSEHIKNLTEAFGTLMSSMQMMMSDEMLDRLEDLEYDDEDDVEF